MSSGAAAGEDDAVGLTSVLGSRENAGCALYALGAPVGLLPGDVGEVCTWVPRWVRVSWGRQVRGKEALLRCQADGPGGL